MKLGKLAPRHDARTLKLEDYLDLAKLPPAPETVDWGTKVPTWGMMKNDALGDCTCAAVGHTIMANTSLHSTLFTPSDDEILKAYEVVGGYVPGDESTDNGADELTVLKYWRKTGIAGHKLGAFADVTPKNFDHIKQTIWLLGSCYTGIALPVTAQGQAEWSVTDKSLEGDAAPGSWGGHAVPFVGYNAAGPVCVTWGQTLQMTWEFWAAYGDEAHAPLSEDWVDGTKEAPSGFNLAQLKADLAALH